MQRRDLIKLGALGALLPFSDSTPAADAQSPASAKVVSEPARQTPLAGQFDVVVCGGGPAGVAAAVAAARQGAKTLLLEAHGCLGGIWTAGLLAYILDTTNKSGLMLEILQRIAKAETAASGTPARLSTCCDPEVVKIVLEQMCVQSGVQVQYHARVCAALVDKTQQNRLAHAITESKSGREAFAGKLFIDCTGDGDLGALAGCTYHFGNPETGLCQPMSMICLVAGVTPDAVKDYHRTEQGDWAGPKDRLRAQMEKGGHSPSYAKPSLFPVRGDLFILMANHEYGVKGTDARDVTAVTLRARQELHNLINGLRSLGGVWSKLRIVATAEQIGVREGRRLAGLYELNAEDLRQGRKHPDAICRATFPIDVHATNPKKEKGIEKAAFRAQPYDIPLRCLIARDVRALLMAGRCISGDFIAHSSYRVTGNAAAMGEAAGVAAALAAAANCLPQDVPWPQLQAKLRPVK